jgi:hypothetical protein
VLGVRLQSKEVLLQDLHLVDVRFPKPTPLYVAILHQDLPMRFLLGDEVDRGDWR